MSEIFDSSIIFTNYPYKKGVTRAIYCSACKGNAAHDWEYSLKRHKFPGEEYSPETVVISAQCQACNNHTLWYKEEAVLPGNEETVEILLYPKTSAFEESANPDMPKPVMEVFNESALVLNDSPRASAALSRLAIDLLTKELNAEGKTLNDRIGFLVSKGLPVTIQKALDSIRVTGNNAVHPGEIDLSDNKEKAISLLKFINIIVDNQITQPRLIDEAYSSLPKGALEAIDKRDKKN